MNIFDILIVQPIFNVLAFLYAVIPGGDFGVSIIVFTIIFRLAMWPLVRKQLHHTKIMRDLAPELEKIKKRTKGNKQQYSMQMMELYKSKGVSPFGPIGILLLQLPIFIALYHVIQIFTSHRDQIAQFTYNPLESFAPIKQLIEHPDQFSDTLLGFISLTKTAISGQNIDIVLVLLAVAAAVTQYIMSKQTMPTNPQNTKRLRDIMADASSGKEADQSEINGVVMAKMIKILPFMMFIIMINLPGALALYYTVLNLVGVVQQHIILKDDEEEMEEIVEKDEKKQHKKATAKAREKGAKTASVTRITAKDSAKKGSKGGRL